MSPRPQSFRSWSRNSGAQGDDRNRTGVEVRSWSTGKTPEFVYVIRAGSSDSPVKIGRSSNPAARPSWLQAGNPVPLALESFVPGGRGLERRLHLILDADRLASEWFQSAPRVELVCEAMLHLWGHPQDRKSPLSRVILDVQTATSLRRASAAFEGWFAELATAPELGSEAAPEREVPA